MQMKDKSRKRFHLGPVQPPAH